MARQFRSDDSSIWQDQYGQGSDGSLTISSNTTDSPISSTISGTVTQSTATVESGIGFAPGQLVLIIQNFAGFGSATAGSWELNKVESYSGTTLNLAYPLENTYSTGLTGRSALCLVMKQYSAVTVDSGQTYSVSNWDLSTGKGGILAFFCNGTTTVNGTISANGGNGTNTNLTGGGPNYSASERKGGFWGGRHAQQSGGTVQAETGYSPNGPAAFQNAPNGGGGGGATVSAVGYSAGGGGAYGSTAADGGGGGNPGDQGTSYGTAQLTTLFMGAGGGGGATGANGNGGSGGDGGGIILIVSKNIVVNGFVTSNGGTGGGGGNTNGGGGGAGGSILFKAETISIASGTNRVNTDLGTGSSSGGNGSVGRTNFDYAISLTNGSLTSPGANQRNDTSLIETARGYSYFM